MGNLPSVFVSKRNALTESLRAKAGGWSTFRSLTLTRGWLFFSLVFVPTGFAIIYYGFIASNRYRSDAQFLVRSASSHTATGLERLFQSFGLSRNVDDGNAVQSYLRSRGALRSLETRLGVREMYSRHSIDRLARYPYIWSNNSFESLFNYYRDHVYIIQNQSKGILELSVVAFEPGDSQRIARELLLLAEEMVNQLNSRAQSDAVSFAKHELDVASSRVVEIQGKLAEYRNKTQFVDPSATSASMLDTITSLSTQLANAIAELDNLRKISPASPSIPALRDKVESLQRSIRQERLKIAGGDDALASKIADYEQLALEQKLAEANLTSASAALDQARRDARRQAIYLEQIVFPNSPDESNEPDRIRMIATVFVLSFAAGSVVWILLAGAKEHVIT